MNVKEIASAVNKDMEDYKNDKDEQIRFSEELISQYADDLSRRGQEYELLRLKYNDLVDKYNNLELYNIDVINNIVNNIVNEFDTIKTDKCHKSEEKKIRNNFVYIAKQTNENNIYKIGQTINIEQRRRTFKTGNIFIEMIASIKVTNADMIEHDIHIRYKNNRMSGEWFYLTEDEINTIIKEYNFNIHIGS